MFEVDEEPGEPHDHVRLVYGLPGDIRLGGPGAGARGHRFPGTGGVQQPGAHPDQRRQHLHRLPALPHLLKDPADEGGAAEA